MTSDLGNYLNAMVEFANVQDRRIAKAREIHFLEVVSTFDGDKQVCGRCFFRDEDAVPWPCDTALALGADNQGYPD